jgi:hypothetical protein
VTVTESTCWHHARSIAPLWLFSASTARWFIGSHVSTPHTESTGHPCRRTGSGYGSSPVMSSMTGDQRRRDKDRHVVHHATRDMVIRDREH